MTTRKPRTPPAWVRQVASAAFVSHIQGDCGMSNFVAFHQSFMAMPF